MPSFRDDISADQPNVSSFLNHLTRPDFVGLIGSQYMKAANSKSRSTQPTACHSFFIGIRSKILLSPLELRQNNIIAQVAPTFATAPKLLILQ
jgi:hypothetical protein